MKQINHKVYKQEWEAALQNKANWYAQYYEIYLYTLPNRTAFNVAFDYDNAARFENLQIYDFTPVQAAYERANDLMDLLLPKDRQWGRYIANDVMLSKPLDWQQHTDIDNANQLIFEYINSSNIVQEFGAAMLDFVGGTAVLKVESLSDEIPLSYKCIPSFVAYLAPYQGSEVENLWIKDQMPGYRIMQKFPKYRGNLYSAMQQSPTQLFDIYTGQVRPDLMKSEWYYYTFFAVDYDTIIFEEWTDYRMITTLRDKVHPGESDGRGIAMDTIWQVRALNQMNRDHQLSITYKANPPIFIDSSLPLNQYSFVNGFSGVMIPKNPGPGVPMEAFQMPDNPDVALTIQDIRNQVRNAFMIDPLGDVSEAGQMTATETAIRDKRAIRTATTDISRAIKDGPEAIFRTATMILLQRGLIPRSIGKLLKNRKIKFDFKSPLYDLQAQDELTDLVQALQTTQQFFGTNAVAIGVEMGPFREYLLQRLNLPHALFKSPEAIKAALGAITQGAMGAQQSGNGQALGLPNLPTPTTSAQGLPALQQPSFG